MFLRTSRIVDFHHHSDAVQYPPYLDGLLRVPPISGPADSYNASDPQSPCDFDLLGQIIPILHRDVFNAVRIEATRETGNALSAIRARTLFGAVHGVVSISLEGRFVGLPLERLAREVDELVQTIAAGRRVDECRGWVGWQFWVESTYDR